MNDTHTVLYMLNIIPSNEIIFSFKPWISRIWPWIISPYSLYVTSVQPAHNLLSLATFTAFFVLFLFICSIFVYGINLMSIKITLQHKHIIHFGIHLYKKNLINICLFIYLFQSVFVFDSVFFFAKWIFFCLFYLLFLPDL